MSNFNVFAVQGNLTADPELVGPEGNVCRFTVAVNNGYGDYASTAYVPCVCFGKQAQTIMKFFKKGSPIIVNGGVSQSNWETKDGEKRSRLELRLRPVEGFNFVGPRSSDEASTQEAEAAVEAAEQQATAAPAGEGDLF